MQILPRLSTFFKNQSRIGRVNVYPSTQTTSGDLRDEIERKLFGMDVQQQVVVKQIISMAGQAVPVKSDTIAIDRNHKPYYLGQGKQVKISENPLLFDTKGNAHIIVIDESDHDIFIKLSDYILDIYEAR